MYLPQMTRWKALTPFGVDIANLFGFIYFSSLLMERVRENSSLGNKTEDVGQSTIFTNEGDMNEKFSD
jgi:hypothetical protein